MPFNIRRFVYTFLLDFVIKLALLGWFFCIHAFQLYTTSNEVTSQPKYISSSQLIEFLFHMNNHAYNLVHIFLCHPLLTIFKPVKKT